MAKTIHGHGGNNVYSTESIIKALEEERGAVYVAANKLGCSYKTILNRAKKSSAIRETINKFKHVRTDKAEHKLTDAIERGEPWAVVFQLRTQGRHRGYYERVKDSPRIEELEIKELERRALAEERVVSSNPLVSLPADVLAPQFLNFYRYVVSDKYTEYVLTGGRGSTKSSAVSLVLIWLIINNPDMHVLAVRHVAGTLRDSVYSQLRWAIDILGLSELFKATVSPLEIEYIPTGQKIYFRGADDPSKIKSIKPKKGYIGAVWFEELDQFHGEEAIRKIEQSAIRGGDKAFIFKSFNPPRAIGNWANKYIKIPKETQFKHESNYLQVPEEWLGKPFLEEAEHLKKVNPDAYEHEYGGVANGVGGMVFNNVVIRKITDEEIYGAVDEWGITVGGFDRVYHGLDFGYYPDPAHYVRASYNPATLTLYIFDERRWFKTSNRKVYEDLVEAGVTPSDMLICDSAEPKSIADLREYGLSARGAEKGPESVNYSMKWLQSLKEIVIDPVRAPHTMDEFLTYEYDVTKMGDIINSYPDRDNHAIDAVRYALNRVWIRRGQ